MTILNSELHKDPQTAVTVSKKERKKLASHTVYRLSIDQPLDVRFRVSVGSTHKTAVLIRGQHQVGWFVQPIRSRCGAQGVGLA